MSILDKINQVKPSTWSNAEIPPGKNYASITLEDNSQEYLDVMNILKNHGKETSGIKKVERIQNPFAYGRFMIRKKQLMLQGCGEIAPNTIFLDMWENRLSDALESNLDERRIKTFFHTRTVACRIIAKCLRSCQYSIRRDSEIYPDYVVYYNIQKHDINGTFDDQDFDAFMSDMYDSMFHDFQGDVDFLASCLLESDSDKD